MTRVATIVAVALMILGVASAAPAKTFLVDPGGGGDYLTIQPAVDAAAEGDTLLLVNGTYARKGNFNIIINKAITIRSKSGNADSCIVDPEGQGTGFGFQPPVKSGGGEAVLENITIMNAVALSGGGIVCNESSPSITGCKIYECYAGLGGGIVVIHGSPTFTNCQVTYCGAVYLGGGAVVMAETGPAKGILTAPVFNKCTFRNNGVGGLIRGGLVTELPSGLSSEVFEGLLTGARGKDRGFIPGGGGFGGWGPVEPTLTGCTIEDNYAVMSGAPLAKGGEVPVFGGGGLFLQDGAAGKIQDCEIRGNTVGVQLSAKQDYLLGGGGILLLGGASPTIERCAIKANEVDLSYLNPAPKRDVVETKPPGKTGPPNVEFVPGGGGILSYLGCSPLIVDCEVDSNLVDIYGIAARGDSIPVAGGGISCQFQGNATIKGCKIRKNVVRGPLIEFGRILGGGGVFLLEVKGRVEGCTVAENDVTFIPYSKEDLPTEQDPANYYSLGGGLCLVGGPYLIDGCTVMDNRAYFGGGLFFEGPEVLPNKSARKQDMDCEIRNTVVVRNAGAFAGGIFQTYGFLGIRSSTVSGNGAQEAGGVIQYDLWNSPLGYSLANRHREDQFQAGRAEKGPYPLADIAFDNCVLWGNCARWDFGDIEAFIGQSAEFVCSDVNKLQMDWNGIVLFDENTIFTDPMFCCPVDCDIAQVAVEMGTWPVWPMADYHIDYFSPCRKANSPCGKRIGALGMGCRGNRCEPFGPGPIGEQEIATVEDLVEGRHLFALHSPAPNPFNPVTEIQFSIPSGSEPSRVTLSVYNSLGQKVRTLVDDEREAGSHQVVWDGTDEGGMEVASGVYFCRLVWNGKSETRRVVLLK